MEIVSKHFENKNNQNAPKAGCCFINGFQWLVEYF